jgi:hypothetical protein
MGEDNSAPADESVHGTGVNDHAWEREHRHPTTGQSRAIGYRRRDAEAKLEQHQQEAHKKAGKDHEGQDG